MKNQKYQAQIKKIEKVLLSFDKGTIENFYKNLETLIINDEEKSSNVLGRYNCSKNIITIYNSLSLCHELFHMAFNDSSRYGKEVHNGFSIDNGISLKCGNKIIGHALTEGFAEYLNRKCDSNKGKNFEYYFADLLISIYGEEILNYALKNEPVKFLESDKFNNIVSYITSMDTLEELFKNVKFIASSMKIIKESKDRNENIILDDYMSLISSTKEGIPVFVLNLFNNIIEEYNLCKNPYIDRESFIKKIDIFCNDNDYDMVFKLSSNEKLKEEILSLKDNVKKSVSK